MREIIRIDEELCDGCGLCVAACAEGAISIAGGKARLAGEVYCDGLGACLGECPRGALSVERREVEAFDRAVVEARLGELARAPERPPAGFEPPAACAGSRNIDLDEPSAGAGPDPGDRRRSELRQWPIQLRLVSPGASFFQGADLLLAADCVAYAAGDFPRDHLRGKRLAIACPKLDDGREAYVAKIRSFLDEAGIRSLTVMIMDVPCCMGLFQLARVAMESASRKVPIRAVVISRDGEVFSDAWVAGEAPAGG